MTYSTYITRLRRRLRDLDKLSHQVFDGDGTTTQFQTTHYPILDNSYEVKVGGVLQTEGTDYTLDKYIGLIEFASAPPAGSDNVSIEFRYAQMRDEEYLQDINDAIDHFREKFWEEVIDDTSITSVANQYDYDLSSLLSKTPITFCNIAYQSSGSTTWSNLRDNHNVIFYRDKNYLHIDPPITTSGLPIKIHYLAALKKGTSLSDPLPIPDKWLEPFTYFVFARFYERQTPDRITSVAMVNTIPTFLPASTMTNLVQYYYNQAEIAASRLAPLKPAITIPTKVAGSSV